MAQETEQPETDGLSLETATRYRWRYRAARAAGMDWTHAKLFASSDIDIEEMRSLARRGCPADLILRVLL